MKCIDTTFLIDLRRNNQNLIPIIKELDKEGVHGIPSIVMHEFLVGGLGSKNKNELLIRKEILSRFIILPFNENSASVSANLEYRQRIDGKFIGTADTFIAATMISHNIDAILTRNVKHFEDIKEIKVISWEK